MRISDWSSDVCSSDLRGYVTQQGRQCVDNQLNATGLLQAKTHSQHPEDEDENIAVQRTPRFFGVNAAGDQNRPDRSEEHTSELQSLMRISYAVFCLKKKKQEKTTHKSTKSHNV